MRNVVGFCQCAVESNRLTLAMLPSANVKLSLPLAALIENGVGVCQIDRFQVSELTTSILDAAVLPLMATGGATPRFTARGYRRAMILPASSSTSRYCPLQSH